VQELKQFPTLRVEVSSAAFKALDRMRDESKKNTLMLVDMECSYLTVDFFRKLPQDVEKGGSPTQSIFDRYNESYLRRIGKDFKVHFPLLLNGLPSYGYILQVLNTRHVFKNSSGTKTCSIPKS